MTVTDFTAAEDERNALVAMSVDVPGFWDLVLNAYSRTTPACSPA
jgi:inosine-uridine nucleoside N-ribohydrolase